MLLNVNYIERGRGGREPRELVKYMDVQVQS